MEGRERCFPVKSEISPRHQGTRAGTDLGGWGDGLQTDRGGHQKDTHLQARPGRPARVCTRKCRGDGRGHRQASAGLGPQTPAGGMDTPRWGPGLGRG